MQLGSLIKKTNEASCLLTQCLAQGIWPRPCTIMLLGKFYTSLQSVGKKPHYPSVAYIFLSFMQSLSYCPPCWLPCRSLPTLLNNYFIMLKSLITLCFTMWLSVTNTTLLLEGNGYNKPLTMREHICNSVVCQCVLVCSRWGG